MIHRRGFCRLGGGILLLAAGLVSRVFSQEEADSFNAESAPEIVRQPRQGEAPRYPRDMVIGELGRGAAPENAWLLARDVMDALLREIKDAPALAGGGEDLGERLFSELEAISPEKYRLGGGRVEADGSVSFLVRFLGRERSMAGELYLVREAPVGEDENAAVDGADAGVSALWRLEDLLLEDPVDLAAEREGYQYDFSPYERFY